MKILATLQAIPRSPLFWIALLLFCLAMEGVALYYQYELDYGPCTLCVHIRAWVFAIMAAALIGLFGCKLPSTRLLATGLALAGAIGMAERSYQTLGIEQGFIDGSCSPDSGFPAWLALDKWLPSVFEPWETCGYTPELLFGITMAQALLAAAVVLVLVLLDLLAVQLIGWRRTDT